ncbi:hypothetical protein [Halopelagius inordinatus]|nr:hypothetical protein [Halopelagius inordinatus]
MHRTIDGVTRRAASLFGSLRSRAAAMGRRKDPRVVVLSMAAFAVVAGVGVGTIAQWPLAGVVLSFVLVGTLSVVYTAPDAPESTRDDLRAFSAAFRRPGRRWSDGDSASTDDSRTAERRLEEAGLLVEEDGLPRVERDFESAWRRRIVSMDGREGDAAALASLMQVSEAEVTVEWEPEASSLVATVRGERAGNWPSRAAFVADVTAVAEFRSAFPEWWSLSPAMRTRVLSALRLCLDWCPVCDGSLSVGKRRRNEFDATTVLAARCEACGADLFSAELDDERLPPPAVPVDADGER